MLEEIVEPLLSWYGQNKRELPWRQEPTPYHVWISEIMLQQTRVEAVKGYYARFLHRLPAIRDLALCPQEELLKLWEGLGYYNRVKNMQKAAIEIEEKYQGKFLRITRKFCLFPVSEATPQGLLLPLRINCLFRRWMAMCCGLWPGLPRTERIF